VQASVVGHPPGELGELGAHSGEPRTCLGVEAAVGKEWRHLRVQVLHNRAAHPVAAESIVQLSVGTDDLLDRVNVRLPRSAAARWPKEGLAQG